MIKSFKELPGKASVAPFFQCVKNGCAGHQTSISTWKNFLDKTNLIFWCTDEKKNIQAGTVKITILRSFNKNMNFWVFFRYLTKLSEIVEITNFHALRLTDTANDKLLVNLKEELYICIYSIYLKSTCHIDHCTFTFLQIHNTSPLDWNFLEIVYD